MSKVVGSIDGYDVIYVEGKNMIFRKNTILPFPLIKRIIRGGLCRGNNRREEPDYHSRRFYYSTWLFNYNKREL